MPKFRRKINIVEAAQFPIDGIPTKELCDLMGRDFNYNNKRVDYMEIIPDGGVMPGDWFIKDGEELRYPITNKIFEEIYEKAETITAETRKPCDHPDCKFYEETEIDYKRTLSEQSLPQVFGLSAGACLVCCRFKRFDMLETEEHKRTGWLDVASQT